MTMNAEGNSKIAFYLKSQQPKSLSDLFTLTSASYLFSHHILMIFKKIALPTFGYFCCVIQDAERISRGECNFAFLTELDIHVDTFRGLSEGTDN